jgi:hypothetical protein
MGLEIPLENVSLQKAYIEWGLHLFKFVLKNIKNFFINMVNIIIS